MQNLVTGETWDVWGEKQVYVQETAFDGEDFNTLFADAWSWVYDGSLIGEELVGCLPKYEQLKRGASEHHQIHVPQECFKLRSATGLWNCSFRESPELEKFKNNAAAFDTLESTPNSDSGWMWAYNPTNSLQEEVDYGSIDKVWYTMYISVVYELLQSMQSIAFVKPVELDIYQNNKEWLERFATFDLSTLDAHDANVKSLGARQVNPKPDASLWCLRSSDQQCLQICGEDAVENEIVYGVPHHNNLYAEASNSYSQSMRRKGGTIVPTGHSLVWKGMSYSHNMKSTLPSWSMHKRTPRQVFGSWIFDTPQRSKVPHPAQTTLLVSNN
jgi:hypothetical protein